MDKSPLPCFLSLAVLVATTLVGCSTPSTRPLPEGTPQAVTVNADPVAAEFNNLYRQGDVYFGGYPTEAGLRAMADRGVTTVVSFKSPQQVTGARGIDEQAIADELGLEVVWLPITPDTFSWSAIDRFAYSFEASSGPVLIHCGSSNSVGGVWALYLHRYGGMPLDDAIARGREVGLSRDSMVDAVKRVAEEDRDSPRSSPDSKP